MQTIENIIKPPKYKYIFPQKKEEILFFDIETTGLSPKTSSLYMIGAMYFDTVSNLWHIKQFFADDYKSEAQIIISFLELLDTYKYLYHFNGKRFDIPYVLDKCQKYNIELSKHCYDILNDTESMYSIDILAMIRPLKKLLSIEKANQTALEKWLGIIRDDKYDGGQLIPIYSQYMQYKNTKFDKSTKLLKLLLLHNHDDIRQMLNVCSILSYKDVFSDKNNITIIDITPENNKCINIKFKQNITVPKSITITKAYPKSKEDIIDIQDMMLLLDGNEVVLLVPIFYGTLKCFYPNHENYNYIEKEGIFIPSITQNQLESGNMLFYITYHDKICFHLIPNGKVDASNPFWKDFVMLQLMSII